MKSTLVLNNLFEHLTSTSSASESSSISKVTIKPTQLTLKPSFQNLIKRGPKTTNKMGEGLLYLTHIAQIKKNSTEEIKHSTEES